MTDLAADKPVKMKKILSLLLALCMLTGLAACSAPVRRSRTYTDVFDTVTEFTVYGGTDEAFERAAGAVHEELLRLHRLFDCHRAYEGVVNLYSLNHAGGETLEIDPDLEAILRLGLEFAEATGGRLNIGLGGAIALWDECREAGDRLPDAAALAEAGRHAGLSGLILGEGRARLADPGLSLNLGALGKGYAAEKAAAAAQSLGLTDFALNLGGNVLTRGRRPDRDWQIGVEDPFGDGLLTVLSLSGQSAVTSGDYQRYFELDGVRYHHILDADTLYPAGLWSAVTVIHADSAVADALSTALFCLPREEGLALLARYGGCALWVDRAGGRYESEGFAAYENKR